MSSKSKILNVVHDGAKDRHEVGLMDEMTMREFDAIGLASEYLYCSRNIIRSGESL
ncbi:MAG: hypothetical protein ACE5GZ_07135 [Gammaproteobacteria bacterium]